MTFFRTFLFLFLLAWTTASSSAQQMQSGPYRFDATMKDYSLDKGNGDRMVQIEITFTKPFDVKPEVIVSVNTLDADKGSNARFEVKTLGVSRDGFTVQVRTWADSKIHGIGGSWLAFSNK